MSEIIEGISLSDKFLGIFSKIIDTHFPMNSAIKNLKESASLAFSRMGFPSKKHEEYRYLKLDSYLNATFKDSFETDPIQIDSQLLNHALVLQDAYRVVLINGIFSNTILKQPKLCRSSASHSTLRASSFSFALTL